MNTTPHTGLTISQAAEHTGLSTDTLRYYERIGLLDPVPRSTAGYRVYRREELEQIRFVLLVRGTGMPIQSMLEYARLRRSGEHTAARRRDMLSEHRRRLYAQVSELEETLRYLDCKIETYDGLLEEAQCGREAPESPGSTPAA